MARVASELRQQMNAVPNMDPIPVIVRRKTGIFSVQAALTATGAVHKAFKIFPGEAMAMTAAEIDEASRRDDIEDIWPDLPVKAWLDVSVPNIGVPQVWATGLKGQGIRIAVIDTGIDDTHPDFAGRIRAMESFVDDTPRDENGHGTHVAGIVAGSGAKSGGKYVGVAPEADLYVAKVLDGDGSGSMSGVMAGIEWAVLDQNVQIINLSLGGSGSCDGTDALSTLCDEAVQQAGVVILAAAGNTGPGAKTVGSPGCARHVITVGATDDNDQMARFSSRGPTSDDRTKPDIVFPGVGITAAQGSGTALGSVIAEGYIAINGTSMATPHASGVAALMLEANPALTPDQVKTQMLAAATNLGFEANEQGSGRGDAFHSYQKAVELKAPLPTPEPAEPSVPEQTLPASDSPASVPKPPESPTPLTPTPLPGCLGSLANLLKR
jgi:subtilisin family serine protease